MFNEENVDNSKLLKSATGQVQIKFFKISI